MLKPYVQITFKSRATKLLRGYIKVLWAPDLNLGLFLYLIQNFIHSLQLHLVVVLLGKFLQVYVRF